MELIKHNKNFLLIFKDFFEPPSQMKAVLFSSEYQEVVILIEHYIFIVL